MLIKTEKIKKKKMLESKRKWRRKNLDKIKKEREEKGLRVYQRVAKDPELLEYIIDLREY